VGVTGRGGGVGGWSSSSTLLPCVWLSPRLPIVASVVVDVAAAAVAAVMAAEALDGFDQETTTVSVEEDGTGPPTLLPLVLVPILVLFSIPIATDYF